MDYLLTLRCAKLIEVRPLLVCQRSVETLQRWLHDLDCLHNCQHLVDRSICLKKTGSFISGIIQSFERCALDIGWLDCLYDALDRWVSGVATANPPNGNPNLPRSWDQIALGDLVVAQQSLEDGWYEAAGTM